MSGLTRRHLLHVTAGAAVAAGAGLTVKSTQAALPDRKEFVVRNAYVMTMDAAMGDMANADLHVRNGEIAAVGPKLAVFGADVIDGTDMILLPGFVDTHFHFWSSMFRGTPPEEYFPLTLKFGPLFKPEDNYRGARLGLAECIQAGVTTVNNWCHNARSPAHADAEVRAMQEMGLRGRYSYGWGQELALDKPMDTADVARIQKQVFAASDLLTLGVAVRTPVENQRGSVTLEALKSDCDGARKLGLPITVHNRAGCVAYFEKNGLLGPDVLIVHPHPFTPEEIQLLVKRNVKVSSSPFGENRMGPVGPRGPILISELLDAGVQQSLSVDEVVTNSKVDYFAVMREVIRIQQQRGGGLKPIHPRRVLELATLDGAKALGLEKKTGSLTVGKRADFVMVRATDINMAPMTKDPSYTLVLAGQPNNIDTVAVDGRILLRNGKHVAVDVAAVIKDAGDAVSELYARDPEKKHQ